MLRLRSAALVVLALVGSTLVGLATPVMADPGDPVPLGLQAGDLVISDTGHDRVIVRPADGGPVRDLATGFSEPTEVVVTPTGDVIVADSAAHAIMRIPADGGAPVRLNPFQGAWGVTHLALDGAGGVLFTGSGWGGIGRVPLTGGNLTLHVYEPPYPNYAGLDVTSEGDLVVLDCCASTTIRMAHDGSDQQTVPQLTYDASADPSVLQPRDMWGLAVTPDDRLLVTDTSNDVVWETVGMTGRRSFGDGLAQPTAVAAGPDGSAYVADSENHRVVRISADRTTQTEVLGSADLQRPSGVAVVPVSPTEIGDVFVGTAAGEVVRVRGSETVTVAGGLGPVVDLVVRDDGEVVVASGDQLIALAGDGATRPVLTSLGSSVQALALHPDGRLLAAVDDGSGGTDVRRVAADGSSSSVDASPLYAFTALAVDDLAETYAAFEVAPATTVVVRTATGEPLFDSLPAVSGLVAEPTGSFLVGGDAGVRRVAPEVAGSDLTSGLDGAGRMALDIDGDVLVASAGDDALLSVPSGGGTPTTLAAIEDPVGVGVWVPRPSLETVVAFPGTGNVGTAYDGYDFDAADNDGGPVTFRISGDLPPGLTLDPSTGELAGTPSTAGDYAFRVHAINGARGDVSAELEIAIGKRLQTLTFTSGAPSSTYPGDVYTPVAASDGSTNPVTISIHPDSSTVCTYDSATGQVTFLIGGMCTILADQEGDADHEDASTAQQGVNVEKFEQTVSFTSTAPADAKVGGSYTPSATSGTPSAEITFNGPSNSPPTCTVDTDGVVHFEHVGLCRVTATVAGDDRHWPASSSQNITVGQGALVFISTTPAPGRVGETYTPAVNAPDTYFRIGEGDGVVCSYDFGTGEVSFLAPGDCEVVADAYNPDYTPDSVSETITVRKQAQQITFTSLAPAPGRIGDVYTPAADGGASGNPVTFSIAAGSTSVCSLTSGEVHLDRAGTCVVQADQAGDTTYDDATATQQIVVARDPGSVTIDSPPATGVVGQRYAVDATTSASGVPVEVSVSTPAVCHVAGRDLVLDHAGTCGLEVSWPGDDDHEPASATQTVVVSAAATAVTLDVRGRVIEATVSVLAPGAGAPTGVVEFTDGVTLLGRAELTRGPGGAMTAVLLRERISVGGPHQVTARYVGAADYAGSQDQVAWVDPAITYTVSSSVEASPAGWYRAPVTVTFHCTPGTAPLVGDCPGPLTLDANRRGGQTVVRDIVARDGTAASVVVSGIRIDLDGPRVRVRGVKPEHTYDAKRTLRCDARDRLSGVERCAVTTKRKQGGHLVTYRVTAVDRAGNQTVVRGRYRLR